MAAPRAAVGLASVVIYKAATTWTNAVKERMDVMLTSFARTTSAPSLALADPALPSLAEQHLALVSAGFFKPEYWDTYLNHDRFFYCH